MFAKDRDLLVLEPYLFRDMAWVGQRLVLGQASVTAGELKFSAADADLQALGLGEGHVVVVSGLALEVLGVVGPERASVSRLRPSAADAAIPAPELPEGETFIATFAPQIAMAHRQVLRMAGIEPDAPAPVEGRPGEQVITNAGALAALECYGALAIIFNAAATASGALSSASRKADLYERLFRRERERAVVELDLDGDGAPDATRRINVVQFLRG